MRSRLRIVLMLAVALVVGAGAIFVVGGGWPRESVPEPRAPRLPDLGGEPSGRLTGANLVFGGHGHEHWHLKFGASYRLLSEAGRQLASQTRAG